jgi:hypothetical protein
LDPLAAMTAAMSSTRCSKESDNARKFGQPSQTVRISGNFVKEFHVRHERRNQHEIDRAVAHDLIGDCQIATPSVFGNGQISFDRFFSGGPFVFKLSHGVLPDTAIARLIFFGYILFH